MSREANSATTDTPQLLPKHHLTQLLREYDKVALQTV
jgi:hypothetical protein